VVAGTDIEPATEGVDRIPERIAVPKVPKKDQYYNSKQFSLLNLLIPQPIIASVRSGIDTKGPC